jgi:hypothetical protein
MEVPDLIAFGRQTTNMFHVVTVVAAPIQLYPTNLTRVAVIIGAPQTAKITIAPDPNLTIDNGIDLYGTGAPLQLLVADFGDAVIKGMFAFGTAAAQQIGVWEFFNQNL